MLPPQCFIVRSEKRTLPPPQCFFVKIEIRVSAGLGGSPMKPCFLGISFLVSRGLSLHWCEVSLMSLVLCATPSIQNSDTSSPSPRRLRRLWRERPPLGPCSSHRRTFALDPRVSNDSNPSRDPYFGNFQTKLRRSHLRGVWIACAVSNDGDQRCILPIHKDHRSPTPSMRSEI